MKTTGPNYKLIFSDIMHIKFPDRKIDFNNLLSKPELSALDILELNKRIFGTSDRSNEMATQKHRSYNRSAIFEILNYQQKNRLNDSQLASHFKISRNSVAKWKKTFLPLISGN